MKVKLYKKQKNPMQSGIAYTNNWVVEACDDSFHYNECMMGWHGKKGATIKKLEFPNQEKAIAYIKENKYQFTLLSDKKPIMKKKSYSDNFI
ncbi:MAG: ETC complex I subunit [Anaplasmataceae bacterium]|nr:ETC complex I subunit [Anaplasmataceae bacterium]